MRLVERLGDVTHRTFETQLRAVGSDDAARLLAAMLKRVEAEISESRSVGVTEDAKHATLFTQLCDLDFSQLSCPGLRIRDYSCNHNQRRVQVKISFTGLQDFQD
jgi:hypothetical protein